MGPHGHGNIFHFCRLRPSQDSLAVGRLPAIPRSLEYRTILYKTTFVLAITWRSGYCYLNKGECKLNQSKDYSFGERVAKNNS